MAPAFSIASNRFGPEDPWKGPVPAPAAFDPQDWVELPAIVDGIASLDSQLAFNCSLRAEAIARRHPEWLAPYEATLVCAAGVLRDILAGPLLLKTLMRLDLSPARRAQVERIAATGFGGTLR